MVMDTGAKAYIRHFLFLFGRRAQIPEVDADQYPPRYSASKCYLSIKNRDCEENKDSVVTMKITRMDRIVGLASGSRQYQTLQQTGD